MIVDPVTASRAPEDRFYGPDKVVVVWYGDSSVVKVGIHDARKRKKSLAYEIAMATASHIKADLTSERSAGGPAGVYRIRSLHRPASQRDFT